MKRLIVLSCLLFLIFIASCSKAEEDDFARYYPNLLPSNEEGYRLLAVGDEITVEELHEFDISLSEITNSDSIEGLNIEYPRIELEQSPAYILFDIHGMVYKTYDYDSLISFMQENPRPKQ